MNFKYAGFYLALGIFLSGCQTLQGLKGGREFVLKPHWIKRTTYDIHSGFRPYSLNGPLLFNDLVITGNSIDNLSAYDQSSGQRIWSVPFEGGLDSSPVLQGRTLYVGGHDGRFVAIEANTGAIKWEVNINSEVLGSPAVDGDFVYVLTEDGRLLALHKQDGKTQWTFVRMPETNLTTRVTASPASYKDSLLAAFSNGSVVQVNKATGSLIWETRLPQGERFKDADATPVVANDKVFVSGFESGLVALDLSSGQILWTMPESTYSQIATQDSLGVMTSTKGEVIGFQLDSGKELWRKTFKNEGPGVAPQIAKGLIVTGFGEGAVRVFDLHSTKELAHFHPGYGVGGNLSWQPDLNSLYFLSNGSNLYRMEIGWKSSSLGLPWEKN